jgi:hypothetical protein
VRPFVLTLMTVVAIAPTASARMSAYDHYGTAHYHRSQDLRTTAGTPYDFLCPVSAYRGHLVIVVPVGASSTDAQWTEGIAADYARRGFAVAIPHPGAAIDDIARHVLATSTCTLGDGSVGVVGVGRAPSTIALDALRGLGLTRVARVAVLPPSIASADALTLVVDNAPTALDDVAKTAEPTVVSISGLEACDLRTSSDPCHASPRSSVDVENARRNISVQRGNVAIQRGVMWLGFVLEDEQPWIKGTVENVDMPTVDDLRDKTVARTLLTVDTLVGYTWRQRNAPSTNGVTALLRMEMGAAMFKKHESTAAHGGYSLGGYGELGTTGDNDFLYGGGASLTTYAGPLGLTVSAGAYGRVAPVNAGGFAAGAFVGLRNLGMDLSLDWETETPIGVRVDGRFGLDARPEQSVSVVVEVAPLALMLMGAGFFGLAHMNH